VSAAAHPELPGRPPVTEIGVASMICVIVGVIYLASYLPRHAPLAPAIGLLAVAAVLFAANVVVLSRLPAFAWRRFFQVARWALLAYLIIAGMLEYTFVYDHTRGSLLVVLTLLLAIFTANVPILLAFTVARFELVEPSARATS
jgi:type III secretory pathway component EscS